MLVLALLTAFAALWVLLGLRWRRETTPPTCRRCGYDVSRRPAGVERCSECGADLTARRAIATVRRRPSRVVTGLGAALLLPVLVLLVANVATFPWAGWFHANAPISWIARLAKDNPGAGGDVYRRVWHARDPSSTALTDHLLDLQGDATVAWTGEWGDVLVSTFRDGRMTDAQKDRFARALFGPAAFKVRSPVRQGDPLVLHVAWPPRGGRSDGVQRRTIVAASATQPAVIDDRRLWSVGVYSTVTQVEVPAKAWGGSDVPPGKHTISVAVANEIVVRAGSTGGWGTMSQRVEHRGELAVEVLPKGSPIGEAIVDPSQSDAVARAVSLKVSHWHDHRLFAEVRLFPAAVDRAFTIYAVIDGTEQRIGTVAAKAGQEATSNATYVPVSVDRAKQMDRLTLVLVGDGEALKTTLDQTRYWAGRIVFPDVAIRGFEDHYESGLPRATTWPYEVDAATTQPAAGRRDDEAASASHDRQVREEIDVVLR